MIAHAFTTTYKMAIDTILLSFCEDSVRTDGKPHCMSERLQKFVDGHIPRKEAPPPKN